MHTNPCANMETHWPVHLKRDPRPTHFEREAGPYALSTRRPRFAGTLRACKCTLSAGRSEREYMTESCHGCQRDWLEELTVHMLKDLETGIRNAGNICDIWDCHACLWRALAEPCARI